MKYTKEFKLEAVKSYLSGETGGYTRTSRHYGLSDKKILRTWVEQYRTYGEAGLDCKSRNPLSPRFKEKKLRSDYERLQIENEFLKRVLEEIEKEVLKKKKRQK